MQKIRVSSNYPQPNIPSKKGNVKRKQINDLKSVPGTPARLAQWLERQSYELTIAGSNPVTSTFTDKSINRNYQR